MSATICRVACAISLLLVVTSAFSLQPEQAEPQVLPFDPQSIPTALHADLIEAHHASQRNSPGGESDSERDYPRGLAYQLFSLDADTLSVLESNGRLIDSGSCQEQECQQNQLRSFYTGPKDQFPQVRTFRRLTQRGDQEYFLIRWSSIPFRGQEFGFHVTGGHNVLVRNLDTDAYWLYRVDAMQSLHPVPARLGAKWRQVATRGRPELASGRNFTRRVPQKPRQSMGIWLPLEGRFEVIVKADLQGKQQPSSGSLSSASSTAEGTVLPSGIPVEMRERLRIRDIKFPDSALEACVFDAVSGDASVYADAVEFLHCAGRGIQLLSGIEHLTGIRALELSGNGVTSIDEISDLYGLKSLDLSANPISGLHALTGLHQLQHLYLNRTQVSDLDSVAGLPLLETLMASNTEVALIPDLSGTSLRLLDLSHTPLLDIGGIASGSELTHIYLSNSAPPQDQRPILFGDLSPLLVLVGGSVAPELIDLTGHPALRCFELDELQYSWEGVLHRPENCLSAFVPEDIGSTQNPSESNGYTIAWEVEGQVSSSYFEIEERYLDSDGSEVYVTERLAYDFSSGPPKRPGVIHYRVRHCSTVSDECSGWSLAARQIVVGSATDPAEDVLEGIADLQLRSCLAEQVASAQSQLSQDELTLLAGELQRAFCNNQGVVSLSNIGLFPNLSVLHLANNELDNLTPLEPILVGAVGEAQEDGSKRGLWLNLSGNQIDSEMLAQLSVSDVRFSWLDLSHNLLVNVDSLVPANSISELRVRNNQIDSLQLLSAVPVLSLYAEQNGLQQLPDFDSAVTLRLNNNQISSVGSAEVFPDSLTDLSLSSNPIGSDGEFHALLATGSRIDTLSLDDTGLTNTGFIDALSSLQSVWLRGNLITEISLSTTHPELREVIASGNPLVHIDFLSLAPSLRLLDLADTRISGIPALASPNALGELIVTGAQLDGQSALSSLSGALSLERIRLSGNGVSDISGILDLIADEGSQLGGSNQPSHYVDLSGEPNVPCRQLSIVWMADLLRHDESQAKVCSPDAPLLTVMEGQNGKRLWFNWTVESGIPGYVSANSVEIEYGLSQASNFNSVIFEVDDGAATIDVPAALLDYYQARIRACRSDGHCGSWSSMTPADHQLRRPIDLALEASPNGGASVEWQYPLVSDELDSLPFFVVSDQFGLIESDVSVGLDETQYAFWISEADQASYPGGIVRVRACRMTDEGLQCGPLAEARRPLQVTDPELPAPENLLLETSGDGSLKVSWGSVDDDRIDYFRVEELEVDPNGRSEDASQSVNAYESDTVVIHQERGGRLLRYRVAACDRDVDREADRCSHAVESQVSEETQTPFNLGSVSGLCWDSDEELPSSGSSGWMPKLDIYWQHTLVGGGSYPIEFAWHLWNEPPTNPNYEAVAFSQSQYLPSPDPGSSEYVEMWSKDLHVGATHQITVWPVHGSRWGSASTSLSPVYWDEDAEETKLDYSTRCDFGELEVSPTSADGNLRSGGAELLSPGHWITSHPLQNEDCHSSFPPDGSSEDEVRDWANQCMTPSRGVATGWQFYWTSVIREEQHGDPAVNSTFGRSYDLIGFWQTYKKLGGVWKPVWYYSRMQTVQQENGGFYAEGALKYPRQGADLPDKTVGWVRVLFEDPDNLDSNRHAVLTVHLNEDGGLVGEWTVPIRDFLLDDSVWGEGSNLSVNGTDHFSGIWAVGDSSGGLIGDTDRILENAEFFVSEWIVDQMISHGVFGFDDSGQPMWLAGYHCGAGGDGISDGGCDGQSQPLAGNEMYFPGRNFAYIAKGVSPFSLGQSGYDHLLTMSAVNSKALGSDDGSGTDAFGLKRSYLNTSEIGHLDRRNGKICMRFSNSTDSRGFSFNTGGIARCSEDPPLDPIRKVANNHFIRYEIENDDAESPGPGGQCYLNRGCHINLTWFTDGEYLDSFVHAVNVDSGVEMALEDFCVGDHLPPVYSDASSTLRQQCVPALEGTFVLELRNDYGEGLTSTLAETRLVTIAIDDEGVGQPSTPPIPSHPPNFGADTGEYAAIRRQSSMVGSTEGEFAVDPSGAATYQIQVMTAKSRGGFSPSLSMDYNHRNGSSALGTGWSIGGLSSIQRCDQGIEFGDSSNRGVMIDEEDAFCLDGRRMILYTGTHGQQSAEYRLEADPTVRITLISVGNGQPWEFKVERHGGMIAWYGSPTSSGSARVQTADGRVFSWPVRVEYDAFGNEIRYHYFQPAQVNESEHWMELLIDSVEYNVREGDPSPSSIIKFHYEPIPDKFVGAGFFAGEERRLTQRLEAIQSTDMIPGDSGRQDIRVYHLEYRDDLEVVPTTTIGQFVLDSVKACSDMTANVCFKPTDFSWDNRLYTSFSGTGPARDPEGQPVVLQSGRPHSVYPVDIDGNGRKDVVVAKKRNGDIELVAYVISDDLTFTRVPGSHVVEHWNGDDVEFSLSPVQLDGTGQESLLYAYTPRSEPDATTKVRRVDFVWSYDKWRFASSGDTLELVTRILKPGLRALDVNGDAIPDLVLWDDDRDVSDEESKPLAVSLGETSGGAIGFTEPQGFSLPMNGSGECEPLELNCYIRGVRARIHETGPFGVDSSGRAAFLMEQTYKVCEDDGEPTPIPQNEFGRYSYYFDDEHCDRQSFSRVLTIKGESSGSLSLKEGQVFFGLDANDRVFLNDVNGDGLLDLGMLFGSDEFRDLRIYFGTGDGFDHEYIDAFTLPWPDIDANRSESVRMMDINGDGSAELMLPSNAVYDDAYWQIYGWDKSAEKFGVTYNGGEYDDPPTKLATGAIWGEDRDLFLDLKGDGRPDRLLVTKWNPQGNESCKDLEEWKLCLSYSEVTSNFWAQPSLVISSITSGFGNLTEIEYGSIQDRSVYQPDINPIGSSWAYGSAVYNLRSPMFVVKRVKSSNPSASVEHGPEIPDDLNQKSQLDYFYVGGKLQAGKRGFLGFRQLGVYNQESRHLKVTDYMQEFPFTGREGQVRSGIIDPGAWNALTSGGVLECSGTSCFVPDIWPASGRLKNSITNEWDALDTTYDSGYIAFTLVLLERIEDRFFLDSEGTQSTLTHRVVTWSNEFSEFGKASLTGLNTYTGTPDLDLVQKQSTKRIFTSAENVWDTGRVECSSSETSKVSAGDPIDVHRVNVVFSYHGASTSVKEELLLEDSADMIESDCPPISPESDPWTLTSNQVDEFGNIETVINRWWSEPGSSEYSEKQHGTRFSDGRLFSESWRMLDQDELVTSKVLDYDRFGNPIHTLNGNGTESFATFDEMGRAFANWDLSGAYSWREMVALSEPLNSGCPAGSVYLVREISTDSPATEQCFDVLGRVARSRKQSFEGAWIHVDRKHDFAGRLIFQSVPHFPGSQKYWTEYDYDIIGRKIGSFETTEEAGYRTVERSYSYIQDSDFGPVTKATMVEEFPSQMAHTVQRQRHTYTNAYGETVKNVDVEGNETIFEYDVMGRMTKTDGPLSGDVDLIEVKYDYFGNKVRVGDPDMGTWHYKYNAEGDLLCQIDSIGNATRLVYDSLGRMEKRYEYSNVTSGIDACPFEGEEPDVVSIWSYGDIVGQTDFGRVKNESTSFTDDTGMHSACTASGAAHFSEAITYRYDDFGRLGEKVTTLSCGTANGKTFAERFRYDQLGRLEQRFDARSEFVYEFDAYDDLGGQGVRYSYNDYGYRAKVFDARFQSGVEPYLAVESQDAWGNTIEAFSRNGMEYMSTYDAGSGALTGQYDYAQRGLEDEVAQLTFYEWDGGGRLFSREFGYADSQGGLPVPYMERFEYDVRDRLLRAEYQNLEHYQSDVWLELQSLDYDDSGNIRCKSDVHVSGSALIDCSSYEGYRYGAGAGGTGHYGPHAIREVNRGGTWSTLVYDDSGNVLDDGIREFEYSTSRRLSTVENVGSGDRTEYFYGTDRQKRIRMARKNGVRTFTYFIGNVEVEFEGDTHAHQEPALFRTHVESIALVIEKSNGYVRTLFKHHDHHGSLVALSDENGDVDSRMNFDPWGGRRSIDELGSYRWLQLTVSPPVAWDLKFVQMVSRTDRGYTGHEHIESMGVIHMNGRIYDPSLGRFLQSDPLIEDTGTLNRYSYVHNNPLGWVDPSGFSARRPNNTRDRGSYARRMFLSTVITSVTIAWSGYYVGQAANAANLGQTAQAAQHAFTAARIGAVGSAMSTYMSTGSLSESFVRGASALVFYGIGQHVPEGVSRIAAHGVAGGAVAAASGGRFSQGFVASAFVKVVSPAIAASDAGVAEQVFAAAVVGGIASEISGGRFANGAVTAAMAYAFNQVPSSKRNPNEVSSEQFELGLEFEVNPANILQLRGGRLGRALEVLGVDMTLSSDGEVALGSSHPSGFGVELAYDGNDSFRLTSPVGSVNLQRADVDMLFGANPPWGPGWEAGFTAQLDPKFALRGNFLVGSVGVSTTLILTPQQRSMVRDPLWWMQNLSGGAPVGMGPDG